MTRFVKRVLKRFLEPRLRRYLKRLVEDEVDRAVQVRLQLKEFEESADTDRSSYWEKQFDGPQLVERLRQAGLSVNEVEIDVKDFERWMARHDPLKRFYASQLDCQVEKVLEHYLTVRLLNVRPNDVLVDVAASTSPLAKVLRAEGVVAYRQDLKYPPGIRGHKIGGDAASMPVPDEFADVLTLHCAFECFQGDADVRFARELCRVLRPGGRVGIVPLYVNMVHSVATSPWCDKRDIAVEPEAKWLWRDDKWRLPFSRHYSPEVFADRIASQMPGMQKRVLFFTNLDALAERFGDQIIYCHFMFVGEKP